MNIRRFFLPPPVLLLVCLFNRHRVRSLAKFCFACSCLSLNLGCFAMAVPLPQGFRDVERFGRKIASYQLNFVAPGHTTKTEFIEKIGQPYLMMDDYGVMAYYWRMLAMSIPWIVASSGVGGGGVEK